MKIIKTVCRRCGNETGFIKKQYPRKDVVIDKNRYCTFCAEKGKQEHLQRMKHNNPMLSSCTRTKVSSTLKRKYKTGEIKSSFQDPIKLKEIRSKIRLTDIGREVLRKKMIENNPMWNSDVAKRVSDTMKKKIRCGMLVYKRGHTHPLYKGTRTFSNDCRKWLKHWIKSVMERDKFSCTACGVKGGYLHTHHIRPLREIINTVLTREGIIDIVSVKLADINRYEQILQKVVDEHKMEDGITVCKQCHANIDDRYRRIKKTT